MQRREFLRLCNGWFISSVGNHRFAGADTVVFQQPRVEASTLTAIYQQQRGRDAITLTTQRADIQESTHHDANDADFHPVRIALIGCGRMALGHLRSMLPQREQMIGYCEPSPTAYAKASELYTALGLTPPPNEPDLEQLLHRYGPELDAALIITPHVYHYAQATACLEAGLDVLLEKPMVITAAKPRG